MAAFDLPVAARVAESDPPPVLSSAKPISIPRVTILSTTG